MNNLWFTQQLYIAKIKIENALVCTTSIGPGSTNMITAAQEQQ